jgi:hypothetical protein
MNPERADIAGITRFHGKMTDRRARSPFRAPIPSLPGKNLVARANPSALGCVIKGGSLREEGRGPGRETLETSGRR